MNIQEQVTKDLLTARVEKDTVRKNLLTTLLGEITASGNETITDDDAMRIISKFKKDAEATIELVNEPERIAQLNREVAILDSYLPSKLSEDDLEVEIETFLINEPSGTLQNVMSHLKRNFPNAYDGRLASSIAKNKVK